MYNSTRKVLVKVHEVLKNWKIRNKKIIHKPTNQGQTMKHNRTCVTLQEMLNEIKLIGEEIEISQIDHKICAANSIVQSHFQSVHWAFPGNHKPHYLEQVPWDQHHFLALQALHTCW
jgi:hypothetical protein